MKKFSIGLFLGVAVFLAVSLNSCRARPESAGDESSLESVGGSKLAGKSYCRQVGAQGGGRTKACLDFKENGKGQDSSRSGGVPRIIDFTYKVTKNKVVVTSVDEFGDSKVREFEMAADLSTLSLKDGKFIFIWELSSSGVSTLASSSFCRRVGALGGGSTETCLNFAAEGKGEEVSRSGGVPRVTEFFYTVTANKVTIVVSDNPAASRTRELALSDDGLTLSMQDGSKSIEWTKK